MGPSASNVDIASPVFGSVQQAPYSHSKDFTLYLKFSETITETLRVVVMYQQRASLNFNSNRNCFLNFNIDQ